MFTFEGHSLVQALQERQLARTGSSVNQSRSASRPPLVDVPADRPSRTARMRFARPLVLITSSTVTRNVGHIDGTSFRQPPHPLHCSRLAAKDSSLAAKASIGS